MNLRLLYNQARIVSYSWSSWNRLVAFLVNYLCCNNLRRVLLSSTTRCQLEGGDHSRGEVSVGGSKQLRQSSVFLSTSKCQHWRLDIAGSQWNEQLATNKAFELGSVEQLWSRLQFEWKSCCVLWFSADEREEPFGWSDESQSLHLNRRRTSLRRN